WKPTTEYADRGTHFAFWYQMYTSWFKNSRFHCFVIHHAMHFISAHDV
ncbi:unnamed protein product, partial [Heterotrigona itama]